MKKYFFTILLTCIFVSLFYFSRTEKGVKIILFNSYRKSNKVIKYLDNLIDSKENLPKTKEEIEKNLNIKLKDIYYSKRSESLYTISFSVAPFLGFFEMTVYNSEKKKWYIVD